MRAFVGALILVLLLVLPAGTSGHGASHGAVLPRAGTPLLAGSLASRENWTNLSVYLPGWNCLLAVCYPQLAYDWSDGYLLEFDGEVAHGNEINETWSFSNGHWTYLTPLLSTQPPAGVALTYDQTDQAVFAYGGTQCAWSCGYGLPSNQTWEFKSGVWVQLHPAHAPPPEADPPTAFDSTSASVVTWVTLQIGSTWTNQTWSYFAGDWHDITSGVQPTGPLGPGRMAYDPALGEIVLLEGSNTWAFAGGTWRNLTSSSTGSPPPRVGMAMTYDNATQSVVLFGGCPPPYPGCSTIAPTGLNDTWSFDGTRWQNITGLHAPSPRFDAGLAFDPQLDSPVLFGGVEFKGSSVVTYNDTWCLGASCPSPSGQTLLSVAISPASGSVQTGGSLVFDATATCSGGPCPAGTAYTWSHSTSLGSLNSTLGPVVEFTAGSIPGALTLTVNASLNGVTKSASATITITSEETPKKAAPGFLGLPNGEGVLLVAAVVAGVAGVVVFALLWRRGSGPPPPARPSDRTAPPET